MYYKDSKTGQIFRVNGNTNMIEIVASVPAGTPISQGQSMDQVANSFGVKLPGGSNPNPAPSYDPFSRDISFGATNPQPVQDYVAGYTDGDLESMKSALYNLERNAKTNNDYQTLNTLRAKVNAEESRVSAIKSRAQQLISGGSGSDEITSFYSSLSDKDKQLIGSLYPRLLQNVKQTTPTTTQNPSSTGNATIDKMIEDILASVVSSGKTINPNLTEADLADLDPAIFLQQAEAMIAPEYREKFEVTKNNLTRELSNIGYDLTKKVEDNARITKQNLETGTEDLAGRGLAFSGKREQFVTETADAKARADESARVLAFRSAQDKGSTAESLIGTSSLQGASLPTINGQRPFEFSTTPLVGSLTSEKQYLKESLAKELETQERIRRAYATRQLSFA